MARRHLTQLTFVASVLALAVVSTTAFAQNRAAAVECRASESGAECHARLKCRANEDIADCQMRLLRCSPDESLEDCKRRAASQRTTEGSGGQDRGGGRDDRGGDDRRGDDRRGDDRRGDDRGRGGRGDDRRGYYDDDNRGRDDRSRRGGRGGRDGGGGGGGGFVANKRFGLGLELGEPSGLTGKLFVSDTLALDFGLGWIYEHYYYGDGIHIYGDFLHHISLASNPSFELPLYIGGGLRFWDFDYCYMGRCGYGASAIGIRVPIGLAFDFNNVPIDIFMQLVPVIDFLTGDYRYRYNRSHFGIDASVGIRFWF